MLDKKMFKETFSSVKASENTLSEVLKMTVHKSEKKKSRSRKRSALALAVIASLMALTATALSHYELIGWIFIDRDADISARSEIAQEALEDFVAAATAPPAEASPTSQPEAAPEAPDKPRQTAQAAVSWLAAQLSADALFNMEILEFAHEKLDGTVSFHFILPENAPGTSPVFVDIGADGQLYGIDLRSAYPYTPPEGVPEEYFTRMTSWSTGEEYDFFLADAYLSELAYPDRTAYAPLAQEGAKAAMAQLLDGGFIDADLSAIEVVYFDIFSGSAAWVWVLLEDRSSYCLYLQPDDLKLLGFALYTPERLAVGDGNADFLSALRQGTIAQYNEAQQKLYEAGVG